MLSDCCPLCLSCPVCNVGVLWPNHCMDQVKLGMQVGLAPGHIVLDSPKGHSTLIFYPYLLWPNGYMHQDAN